MIRRRAARAVVALVRATLALYPARFRRRFGGEIVQSAEADLEQSATPGAFAGTSARELTHAVSGILPQHRLERAHRGPSRRLQSLRSIGGDARAAVRSLRKAPTFTIVALSVLALGIGAATAVFSVVDGVLLRALPFEEHDRLAVVLEYSEGASAGQVTTMQTFLDWRKEQRSFESLSAVARTNLRMRSETDEPLFAQAQRVTHEFFDTLGVRPQLGRTFTSAEEFDSGPRVVAISHGLWQRQFGGAPDVIGRALTLDDEPWEIVAVMPAGFTYPVAAGRPTDVYVPARNRESDLTRRDTGRNYTWTVIGRLRPGVSMAQAQDELHAITASLHAQFPEWYRDGSGAQVMSLHHFLVGSVRAWMLLLLASVAIVLVIACANVANLMLARATVRAREMGIRAALGAGRWRLTRLLIVEGLVLAGAGAALGVLVAQGAVSLITASLPATLPRAAAIAIDLRVVAAAAAAAIATGLLFGLLPALQSARPEIARALRDGGRAMTSGRGGGLRSMLVIAEVALAVVLLVGAGLFTGSFIQLMRIEPGFDYERVLTFGISPEFDQAGLAEATRRGREARAAFFADARRRNTARIREVIDVIRQVPGVESVATVNGGVPLTGSYMRTGVTLPDRQVTALSSDVDTALADNESIDLRQVSAGYLETLRVPLIAGRFLTPEEIAADAKVIVVNETAAARYWPGASAIGQQISVNSTDGMRTVVGIVGDMRHLGPESPRRQEAYVPLAAALSASAVVRTSGDPMTVLPAVKRAVWSVMPDQVVPSEDVTLESYLDQMLAQRRFTMALLALLGVLALVIAAAGVYGVMAYVVSQRTQEIGVRMALGARPADVVSMVMNRAGLLIASGLAVGGVTAWMFAAGAQQFLFLVASNDWRVFAAAVALLAATGMAACAIPARRAARVDPLIALRGD